MVVNNNNNASKSKSLDYTYLNRNGYYIKEESPPENNGTNGSSNEIFWQVPGKEVSRFLLNEPYKEPFKKMTHFTIHIRFKKTFFFFSKIVRPEMKILDLISFFCGFSGIF